VTEQPCRSTGTKAECGNTALDCLRWHWGSAYEITCDGRQWKAQRRDSSHILTDTTPGGLRDQIITDYLDQPSQQALSPAVAITLSDVRHEFGDRWDIAPVTGGYRAVPRDTSGHSPIPRYGRTPAELAESIHVVEAQR
jgi:hypothetical protein